MRSRCLGSVVGGAVAVAVAAGGMIRSRARQSGISVPALLANTFAAVLAPDRSGPEAFERGIENNRKNGPALPPKRLRKWARFSDEWIGPDRVFRLEPRSAEGAPLRLLYLHGGAYVHEVQAIQWNLVAALLRRQPGGLIAPVYPLAPEHSWREGIAAAERVYSAAVREVGASNVIVLGDSAGGGLALALAQRLRDSQTPMPTALALFSPWLDVGMSGADQPRLEKRDPVLTRAFLRRAGELWAAGLPLDDPRVSPLFGDHTDLPPTIVFSGSRDVLDSDALRLAERNPAVLHRHYPEMMHVWQAAPIPEAKRALDEAAVFLRQHIHRAHTTEREQRPS